MGATGMLNGRGVTLTRLAAIFLVLLGVVLLRDQWLPDGSSYRSQSAPSAHKSGAEKDSPDSSLEEDAKSDSGKELATATEAHKQSCADQPGAENVLVLLKTGATELYQKLPTHFVTTFTCVPNFMIFSDLAQNFADYPIYDAIAPVSKHFRDHHEDFELYRKLQDYQREGQDMSKLKGDGGWNLDKWKFLPMLHQAFESAGDEIEWFLMIEADTSISWTNLLQWLKQLNYKKPYYAGAQNVIGDTQFAHGGSGVLISRKAADMMKATRDSQGHQAYDEKWEEITSTSCCGDEIIARALKEAGVLMNPAWPKIQGETVSTLDWTDKHWCTPAISWHHVSPLEVDSLFQFQSQWVLDHGWEAPYLFRDVFDHYISRHVSVNRTNWNNLSQDRKFVASNLAEHDDEDFFSLQDYEQEAVKSAEACAAACERKKEYECIQWMFTPGRCHLGKDIRFGKSDDMLEQHWTSGWVQERLEAFREKHKGCKPRWYDD